MKRRQGHKKATRAQGEGLPCLVTVNDKFVSSVAAAARKQPQQLAYEKKEGKV